MLTTATIRFARGCRRCWWAELDHDEVVVLDLLGEERRRDSVGLFQPRTEPLALGTGLLNGEIPWIRHPNLLAQKLRKIRHQLNKL